MAFNNMPGMQQPNPQMAYNNMPGMPQPNPQMNFNALPGFAFNMAQQMAQGLN